MIMIAIANPRFLLLAPLLLLLHSIGADAQHVVFSASASASKVGTADQFQVTYSIQNVGEATFNPGASLREFRVLAGPFRSAETQVDVIGNQMVQSVVQTFTFVLQPKHPGIVKMVPATIIDGSGHSYKSNPLQIEVVRGSVAAQQQPATAGSLFDDDLFGGPDPFAAMRQQQARLRQLMDAHMRQQAALQAQQRPQAAAPANTNLSRDLFIRVEVDKKQVKLGEQVTALYKLYSRIPMQVNITKLPLLNGFWNQDFDIPQKGTPFEEIIDGRRYNVYLLKKSALFPQQSGTLTLDAAEAGGTVYGGIPVHLKSTPVKIQVSDPPAAGRPAGYTSAVGRFSLSGTLDKTTFRTDEVATLTVKIAGSGNLKLFVPPTLSLPGGLNTYTPDVFDTITGRSTTISGEKIIKYSIAPSKAGDYEIPPMNFSWYDPQSGRYQSAATRAYRVHVTPGKASATASFARSGGAGGDIHDGFLSAAARPLILSPVYWSMYALPLLLLGFITFRRRRENALVLDSAQQRNRHANRVAQKRLALAGEMLQKDNPRGFYDEISKAIWLYLSDKLNIPLSGLGRYAALEAMDRRGIPTPVQQQISKVLDECELALYASSGNNHQMQQTFSEAAGIITGLERTLRSS